MLRLLFTSQSTGGLEWIDGCIRSGTKGNESDLNGSWSVGYAVIHFEN